MTDEPIILIHVLAKDKEGLDRLHEDLQKLQEAMKDDGRTPEKRRADSEEALKKVNSHGLNLTLDNAQSKIKQFADNLDKKKADPTTTRKIAGLKFDAIPPAPRTF